MNHGGRKLLIGLALLVVGGVAWALTDSGVFQTNEDLASRGASLTEDAGIVLPPMTDAGAPDNLDDAGTKDDDTPTLGVAGRGLFVLNNFSLDDHQGNNVLRAKHLKGRLDLGALRRGTYRIYNASASGVELTLLRDPSGELSLTSALREEADTPPGAEDAPKPKDHDGGWLIEIGPMRVTDAIVNIDLGSKEVQIQIDTVDVIVRRRPENPGPRIYFENVVGELTKPKPLKQPVRIAYAKGLVRLVGAPMVDLLARTCIRRDELRAKIIVPKKRAPVEMTVDSAGMMGLLGRMGLKIASRRKHDKLHYEHGAVNIEGGAKCH